MKKSLGFMLPVVALISFLVFVVAYNAIHTDKLTQEIAPVSQPSDNSTPEPSPAPQPTVMSCVDVTSYDYNWNNDIKCTRSDGSTFYTSYSGAVQYGYHFAGY